MPNSRTNKNVFSVTSIALICARVCTQLLQPLAQSLIGSPGTLDRPLVLVPLVPRRSEDPLLLVPLVPLRSEDPFLLVSLVPRTPP